MADSNAKLGGYEFYNKVLGGPKMVVAPMVDQSELAWRILSRRHGSELCYTPMLHASVFIRDARYRKEGLASCKEDRPLIVQFCANNPEIFVKAGLLAQSSCDAIDLNLGCPQTIAKRGHYGAFLQDDWELITKMVQLAHEKLSVPITCKIRVFPDKEKTIRYAQMLEKAGCQILTVHGRTREMKGPKTGLADWDDIKVVKDSVSIPVFANGNIQYLSDVERCIEYTGVDGVMTAEGNLHNPALFEGKSTPIWEMSKEYLEIVKQYQCPLSYIRGHLFKMWLHSLEVYIDLRVELAKAKSLPDVINVCDKLEKRAREDMEKGVVSTINKKLKHPYWICQPYVRPTPEESMERSLKRPLKEESKYQQGLSRTKQKRIERNPRVKNQNRGVRYDMCVTCGNPRGLRCVFQLCRRCCKSAAFKSTSDCPSHHLMFKTKLEKRLKWEAEQAAKNGEKTETPCQNCTSQNPSDDNPQPDSSQNPSAALCSSSCANQTLPAAPNVSSPPSLEGAQVENTATTSQCTNKENDSDYHGNRSEALEQHSNHGNQGINLGRGVCGKKDDSMECGGERGSDEEEEELNMEHDGERETTSVGIATETNVT